MNMIWANPDQLIEMDHVATITVNEQCTEGIARIRGISEPIALTGSSVGNFLAAFKESRPKKK
jgi:hypothetical protein